MSRTPLNLRLFAPHIGGFTCRVVFRDKRGHEVRQEYMKALTPGMLSEGLQRALLNADGDTKIAAAHVDVRYVAQAGAAADIPLLKRGVLVRVSRGARVYRVAHDVLDVDDSVKLIPADDRGVVRRAVARRLVVIEGQAHEDGIGIPARGGS